MKCSSFILPFGVNRLIHIIKLFYNLCFYVAKIWDLTNDNKCTKYKHYIVMYHIKHQHACTLEGEILGVHNYPVCLICNICTVYNLWFLETSYKGK